MTHLVFWLLAVASIVGALGVVLQRDVTRMALSLGVFLMSVAGWFLFFAQPFLAVAQVFVYVGGVLVLMLYAIMLLHRDGSGVPELGSRHSLDAAMVAIGVFVIVSMTMRDVGPILTFAPISGTPEVISELLLGDMLPHFEALGVLLLAALAAVLAIVGGDRS